MIALDLIGFLRTAKEKDAIFNLMSILKQSRITNPLFTKLDDTGAKVSLQYIYRCMHSCILTHSYSMKDKVLSELLLAGRAHKVAPISVSKVLSKATNTTDTDGASVSRCVPV